MALLGLGLGVRHAAAASCILATAAGAAPRLSLRLCLRSQQWEQQKKVCVLFSCSSSSLSSAVAGGATSGKKVHWLQRMEEYAARGAFNRAFKLYHKALAQGVEPDSTVFVLLMRAACHQAAAGSSVALPRCVTVVNEMNRRGVPIAKETLVALMETVGEMGHSNVAGAIGELMTMYGMKIPKRFEKTQVARYVDMSRALDTMFERVSGKPRVFTGDMAQMRDRFERDWKRRERAEREEGIPWGAPALYKPPKSGLGAKLKRRRSQTKRKSASVEESE